MGGLAARRARVRTAATIAAAALVALGATPSAQADRDGSLEGLWYYSTTGVDEAHAQTTGEGVTIALLDSAVNLDIDNLAGADIRLHENYICERTGTLFASQSTGHEAEHGTAMAELLVGRGADVGGYPGTLGVAPDATILAFTTTVDDRGCDRRVDEAVRAAVDEGADIISMSFSGAFTFDGEAFAYALAEGVVIVNSMPNDAPSELGWPATANGVVTVEAHDIDGQLMEDPVVSPLLTVVSPGAEIVRTGWEDGRWSEQWLSSGASEATAFTSGVLALLKSQHPEATGDQLIQALIRTTGGTEHEPTHSDDTGYGLISVPALLAVDPTTLPDENPVLRDDDAAVPTIAQIEGTASDETAAGDADGADPTEEPEWFRPVATGVALVVALAIVLLVIASARRQKKKQQQPPPGYNFPTQ